MPTKQMMDVEQVQYENRISLLKEEHERLLKANNELQEQIDQKSVDYNIYLAQKDSDSKRMRQDVMNEREQLNKDKAEFQSILLAFKQEKEAFAQEKKQIETNDRKAEEQLNNVRQFVIAVQRAVSLLNL